MEESPETVKENAAGAAPEASQRMTSPPPFDEQRALKRASLPARPNLAARHSKRLTLNFPINVPTAPVSRSDQSSPSPGLMTPATQSSAHPSPALSATTVPIDDSNDGYDFLNAIASQERKVLELREELYRAETELATLKKQWASTERSRKRTQINLHAEAMKPLRFPDVSVGEPSPYPEGQSAAGLNSPSAVPKRFSRELQMRDSIRATGDGGTSISANGRRVFHGSRHTRTLSLLSPDLGGSLRQPFPQPRDTGDNKAENVRISRSPRSATLPSMERSNETAKGSEDWKPVDDTLDQWRRSMPPPSREALVRTGKQMASDLREGLWTFLEDIRQATVGEEGISGTESRSMQPSSSSQRAVRRPDRSVTPKIRERSAAGTARSTSSASKENAADVTKSGKDTKPADIGVSFWSEFGVDTPGQQSMTTSNPAESTPSERKEQGDSNLSDADDNWDLWDTPQPNKTHTPSSSSSTIGSKRDQSPTTQASSPRTSASFGDWNPIHPDSVPDPSVSDGIPWPALTKLNPSKLTRTASSLMAEWERSLSPSPERSSLKRNSSQSSKRGKSD